MDILDSITFSKQDMLYDISIRRIELEAQLKLANIDHEVLKESGGMGNPVLVSQIKSNKDRLVNELNNLSKIEFDIMNEKGG